MMKNMVMPVVLDLQVDSIMLARHSWRSQTKILHTQWVIASMTLHVIVDRGKSVQLDWNLVYLIFILFFYLFYFVYNNTCYYAQFKGFGILCWVCLYRLPLSRQLRNCESGCAVFFPFPPSAHATSAAVAAWTEKFPCSASMSWEWQEAIHP